MADVDMENALPELGGQLPLDPDAQATVTDFHDYTEFFPSDLIRSLTLIRKLDQTYLDNTQRVHNLTTVYGSLPSLPANQRVDPQALRKQISAALDHAIHCRESALAEAARLYDVAERHCTRLGTIKKKLQALPEPPSRDPTPPPVSPALRRRTDAERTPRLTLNGPSLGARPVAAAARLSHGGRRTIVPGEILPLPELGSPIEDTVSDDDDESRESSPVGDGGNGIDAPSQPKRGGKPGRVKVPKQPRNKLLKAPRIRPPGQMGTNVHSAVAGISTSNALAKLDPPPPDAKPGSRHAPWHKLTEYEMAWLRKTMKKNAIWNPSDTMIRRELTQKGRGRENYEREKERCMITGDPFIDEDPMDPLKKVLAPGETTFEPLGNTDVNLSNRGMKLNEAKKLKKETMAREQAARDAIEIEEASRMITATGDIFKNLFNHKPAEMLPDIGTAQKKEPPKSSKKRKREGSAEPAKVAGKDLSSAAHEVGARPSGPKKIKLAPPAPPSSTAETSIPPQSEDTPFTSSAGTQPIAKTTTVLVPLLPAGPSNSPTKPAPPHASRKPTPGPPSPTAKTSAAEQLPKPPLPVPAITTAATSRSRRASLAPTPKASSPPPNGRPSSRATTAQPPSSPPPVTTAPGRRPNARAANTKAASVEPTTKRESRDLRRRGSNVSLPPPEMPARETRTRGKRPAPGVVTEEDGGKGKVSVGKRKAAPRKKGGKKEGGELKGEKKIEAVLEEAGEDIDPNEPRYCVCGDVSYGTMVACENDDCETEWFHLPCVGLTDIPPRRAKWYCPDCRKKLAIDEKGHAMSDPPKGRR
ncbi:hypothetical protein W97_02612 [Coniosporium apollinis CBS 100218]|uniref:Chromatin modification-related protein n=1 Tax=Coniosporium apollinis (strain CBS 100218) TaxID=1168221 RepID=R7YN77_CONA1|nr:uncharacterized protein W97_02612 [Coniosporium apollinis CBS 100218]EON63385.1 hypothetical protein W97_02612 [Coniosporium apollinis CBS 100218]